MKTCKLKKIFYALFIPFIFLIFSCDDVIFYEIRKEVKLEDPDVAGSINCIVRFKEYIYTQNGNVFRKVASSEAAHGWVKIPKPTTNADYNLVNKLAADSNYLYAQVSMANEDRDEGENLVAGCRIYYSDDGVNWQSTPIVVDGYDTFPSGSCRIFCTNAPKEANRKAYLAYNGKIYELNGGSTPAEKSINDGDDKLLGVSKSSVKNCAFFGSDVYFYSGAMATDETESVAATHLYYSDGSSVSIKDSSGSTVVGTDCSTIYSLSVTSDYLYLGTADGIQHIPFNSNKTISGSTTSGLANAESTLSSYYEVRCVLAMFADRVERDNVIYATTTFTGSSGSTSAKSDNCGLWSYLASRDSWNKE